MSEPTTTLVKEISFANGRTLQYEYDAEERITKVTDSEDGVYEYTYDSVGQLLTEKLNGVTVNTMTYDGYGNIRTKNGASYAYDSVWKDKLLSINGSTIEYDENGNPTDNGAAWEKGRQLYGYADNEYTYNSEGIRTSKTISGCEHIYTLDGSNIIKECWEQNVLVPLYDLDGTVCGIEYNGTAYYFYKNLQGDVIAITDDTGATVAKYRYDAWGKCTIVSDTTNIKIATVNPFRYRSYYYDHETGWYYLQSRYYDPNIGRFINRDAIKYIGKSKLFNNLYCYCVNSPVCNIDANGKIPRLLIGLGIFAGIALIVGAVAFLTQDFNRVSPPDSSSGANYELYLKVHFVAFGMYHSCLVIFSDSSNIHHIVITDERFKWQSHPSKEEKNFFTIGAGGGKFGFAGKLTSAYNREKDIKLDIAVEMKKLGTQTGNKIQEIVKYHEYYMAHDKPSYAAVPGKKSKKYNCNSFAHGLLNVVNIGCSKPTHKVPGWDKPLPKRYFGI